MRVAIGSDHAGFELKRMLCARLREANCTILDVGTNSAAPVDYPDYAEAVGDAVRTGNAERGILICGSGVGASIAANKLRGVRAGLCHDAYSARQGVEHAQMNVLVLGARVVGPAMALELAQAFLKANFDGAERHRRRLEKVKMLEARFANIAHSEMPPPPSPETLRTGETDRQSFRLGAIERNFDRRLTLWEQTCFSRSLWAKDYRLWSPQPAEITDRLGWLTLPETMQEQADEITRFANEIRDEGFRHVVLMGMGGSSLAPEVFQHTFGNAPGYPELMVLDSTHPAAVRAAETKLDLPRTLFLVSSKSGTTLEMLSLYRYFWRRAGEINKAPGRQFVAITDAGTPLEKLARERGFRRSFLAASDVGGRYSALTVFGLVPAALIGMDIQHLLDRARIMAEACASCVSAAENPGLSLGAALGELALAGYDKATFFASPGLRAFPAWVEQLIAESTGKQGKGIIPVVDEPPGPPSSYGADRVLVYLALPNDPPPAHIDFQTLASGFPSIHLRLGGKEDLAQEFFRWEVAIAAAGAALGIHPFDQPDVELAKELARKAMANGGSAASHVPELSASNPDELRSALQQWMRGAEPGRYVAIQAYLPPAADTTASLQALRGCIRDRTRCATTLGFGPRFLHSTGQLHKGGPDTGLFLQLVDDPANDVPVPETDFTFGALIRAQAVGDYHALVQRNRRVLRVNLGRDVARGLASLHNSLAGVLGLARG